MNGKIFKLTSALTSCLLLFGCQPLAVSSPEIDPKPLSNAVEPEQKVVTKPFTEQQLYDLLLGELAGVRGNISLALEKYSTQAQATRDPQVVERAARIASYSNNQTEIYNLATLWVELAPENPEALHMAAIAMARKGELLQALPYAENSLANGDSEPLMTIAVLAEKASNQVKLALLKEYPRLKQQFKNHSFWIYFTEAMLLRSSNQLKEAEKSASQALKLSPVSESAALLASQIYHQQGDKNAALETLEKALQKNPDSKRLHIQYVRFMAEFNPVEAMELLKAMVKQYPEDTRFAFSYAKVLLEQGLEEDAKRVYQRLIKHTASASQAYLQLGLLEQQQGHIDSAIAYLRNVRGDNLVVPVAARISSLLSNTGRIEEAQLYLQKLRLDHPDKAANLYQIESELLIEQALHQDAYGLLSNAIEIFPANISLLYTRSIVGEQLKQYGQAEQDLRSILELDSDNAMALNALGYTLTLHTTRYQEAHQLILRSLEINPDDPAALDSLGWVLFHMKRYEEAITQLENAWAKLPDAEIAAHLGEAYWVAGRKDDALKVWHNALEKTPENPIILKTMERLQRDE